MPDLPPHPLELADRRIDRRVPFEADVTQYGDTDVIWKAANLSDGGMFLTGNPLLAVGTDVELGFKVPGNPLEILCDGTVQWKNHPDLPGHDPKMPIGIGVEFVDIDPECKKLLLAFMEDRRVAEPPATIEGLIADTLDEFTESPGGGLDANDLFDEPPVDEDDPLLAERLEPGCVLGSYRLAKWLGSGGMGDVYLAEHVQLGRMVALKRLRSEFASNRMGLNRFFQEARAVNQIHHENIVEITDFIQTPDHTYCVMEFLDGPTLAASLEPGKMMPISQVVNIAGQVCDALAAVHEAGIVHRDLKPQNIMLVE
ncbi:MAG: protein kinase, partial [Myxococcota bacterium]